MDIGTLTSCFNFSRGIFLPSAPEINGSSAIVDILCLNHFEIWLSGLIFIVLFQCSTALIRVGAHLSKQYLVRWPNIKSLSPPTKTRHT